MTAVPAPALVDADAVDPPWLTAVLRRSGLLDADARVDAVQHETCGTGQLGDSFRFSLTYDPPHAGPVSVVGKFASADPTSREFGRSSGYYRNEIRFYDELAPHLPVSVPAAIHTALAEDHTDFVLVMEDLAPARSVDQLVGCTPDEMALVVEQTAALHAASWHDAALAATPWLGGTARMFHQVTDGYADVIHGFGEHCGDLVDQSDLDEAGRLVPLTATWKRVLDRSQCLWHSDIRADNVLFDAQDGARPVVILDWQGLGYGPGTLDLPLCLGTSLSTDDRRDHERALIDVYHRALVAGGVQGYTAEECWNDYRMQAVHGLQVGVFGLGAVKRTPRGDRMWKSWIERTAAQVRDLDSLAVLAGSG